ncbi:unnamed protein product [Nyctereutes procyonoides]|uniref:(raccoon dog) hypothetical protein n=1 Tax=Nyctereutes procyonoides TaxID=34880 RepID=A0A811YSU2_NYCPR|nr:unnamed protein product [Nyctereutes procyonoides]
MGRPALLLLALCAAGARGLYFHIGETEKRCFIEEIPDETMVIGNYRTQMWDKQKEVFLPSTPGLGMHVEVKDPEGKVVLSRQYGSEGRFTFTSHMPGDHQICLHSNSTRMALFAGGRLRVHLDIQVGEHANNYPEIAAKDKLTELQLRARQLLDQVEQIQKEQDYQRVSTYHCTETWQLTFVLAGSLCIGHVLPGSSATETGVDSVRRAQLLGGGSTSLSWGAAWGAWGSVSAGIWSQSRILCRREGSHDSGNRFSCILILARCPTQYREERFRLTSESTNQRVLWWSIAQTAILLLTGIWQMRHLKSFFEAKKLV